MTTLTTARLVLEPQTIEHADLTFDGFSDPSLYEFIPGDPPADREALRAKFARVLRGTQSGSGELWLNWAIREAASGSYVGFVETSVLPGAQAHIAYFIFQNAQRKGYAKEACQTVLTHLAATYRLTKVETEMDTRNAASWRLVEALGFNRISEARDVDFFKGSTSHEYLYRLDLPPMGE